MTPSTQSRGLLVIGYGNTLRNDDGVGPRVAEAAAELRLPNVQTLSCTLLTPELAEPLSRAERVVFVDAAIGSSRTVQLRRLQATESSQITGHSAAPGTLLALARDLFGHAPAAWLLAVPVANLELGDRLSTLAEYGLKTALDQVRQLAGGNLKRGA